jgi:hypothetical protein
VAEDRIQSPQRGQREGDLDQRRGLAKLVRSRSSAVRWTRSTSGNSRHHVTFQPWPKGSHPVPGAGTLAATTVIQEVQK